MALEGTLSYLDISHLLQVVGSSRKSGVLEIWWEDREARLLFREGRLIRAESNRVYLAIGALLLESRLVAEEELARALEIQQAEGGGRRLGTILCDDLGVSPEAIERLLRHQFERVVYDLFSWPGGHFAFQFEDPGEGLDRFHLNPAEFILGVGIQAGLLAQDAVEREQRDPDRPPFMLLLRRPELAERCRAHWRRKGHRVTVCERPEEVLGCLGEWDVSEPLPVVVADLAGAGDRGGLGGLEVAEGARDLRPEVRVVLVGDSVDPKERIAARSRGAAGYVRAPGADDLAGPQRETHLDVFLMQLERVVQMAAEKAAAGAGAAG
ncbi:MAG: DUF4388 domain-containing protein [Deferrisomatales bacterium]